MNTAQARHAQAMAHKIREHAEVIVGEMEVIESLRSDEVEYIGLEDTVCKLTHDSGYGVQDRLEAIEAVLQDMLPELESM